MSGDAVVLPDGWLGSPEWYRDTRGRGYEFELPTGQIVEALHVVADALGDDFDLLAYRLVEGPDGRWFNTFEVQPVSALEFVRITISPGALRDAVPTRTTRRRRAR